MTLDDAIEFAAEKSRVRNRCDCLDCQALEFLAVEIERLRKERDATTRDVAALEREVEVLIEGRRAKFHSTKEARQWLADNRTVTAINVNAYAMAIDRIEEVEDELVALRGVHDFTCKTHNERDQQLADATAERDALTPNDDDDPEQTAAIDAWIATVLGDSGIKAKRTRDGLDFGDVPAKWLVVLQRLRAGIHAAARGQELPDAEPEPEPEPEPPKPEPPKSKKR